MEVITIDSEAFKELMEKLDHANTVEEYWKLIISMDGLEDS